MEGGAIPTLLCVRMPLRAKIWGKKRHFQRGVQLPLEQLALRHGEPLVQPQNVSEPKYGAKKAFSLARIPPAPAAVQVSLLLLGVWNLSMGCVFSSEPPELWSNPNFGAAGTLLIVRSGFDKRGGFPFWQRSLLNLL